MRKLIRRCRAAVDQLDIPEPFDVGELCRRTGQARDRPITIAPLPLSGAAPCGLWLGTPSTDLIFFEANTSPAHQDHIILHELGHVLCHEQDGSLDEDLLRMLFPDLSLELVRNALGRTRYSAVEEQKAEIFAHLVLARVWRTPLTAELPNGLPTISSRYADSPWVTEYQLIVVAFLGLATGVLFWIGARYSKHAARGPLRVSLRLLQIGGGLAVLSLLHRLVFLVVISAGGSLPWYESGTDGVQSYLITPALLCVLAGITMPKWGPRLLTWHRRRRWYRLLRPLWIAHYQVDREIAFLPPRPAWIEALTVTRIGFRLSCCEASAVAWFPCYSS